MERLGTVHESVYANDSLESQRKTVYLHNARLTLEDNTEVVIPYAHLNHYNCKHKKYSMKQLVLTQVTLWDKSTLPANHQFVIKAINHIPFRLWGRTDENSRMTARDQPPVVQKDETESSIPSASEPMPLIKKPCNIM